VDLPLGLSTKRRCASRSGRASETRMPIPKASGIEIRAGLASGKIASSRPRTSTMMVGEIEISTSDETAPTTMLETAPAVV
jgi:hypothetical protein